MISTRIFVTGISTEIGKTVVSSVLAEALEADYWKPIQAGDLDYGDGDKVRDYISNEKTIIHPNSYRLKMPMSPHAAAAIDGINIKVSHIKTPQTNKTLVVEGAGGLMVPLNKQETIADLILPEDKVILVSKHYLGSINHTLLSIALLKTRNIEPLLIYSGKAHPSSESIIASMSDVKVIGRIEYGDKINKAFVKQEALKIKHSLTIAIK